MLLRILFTSAILATALGVALHGGRRLERGRREKFLEAILADAACWLSGRLQASPDGLLALLREWHSSGSRPAGLSDVLGLEWGVSLAAPGEVIRCVVVAMKANGHAVVGELKRPVEWPALPHAVRRSMLLDGRRALAYVLLEPERSQDPCSI